MSTLEQKYQKLLNLALASQYYLEGTDNEDPTALVAYLKELMPTPTAPVLQTYIVWNIQRTECETYAELLALEESTTYGYSSHVHTTDIQGVLEAVINETDATLGYALYVPDNMAVTERIT
jgi:hypothetical protein